MSIDQPSEKVRIARLGEDPQFTEDLDELETLVRGNVTTAILDFSGVNVINSSNLAKLLKIRVLLTRRDGRLILCGIPQSVWTTFHATGLDNLFEFRDSVEASVAALS